MWFQFYVQYIAFAAVHCNISLFLSISIVCATHCAWSIRNLLTSVCIFKACLRLLSFIIEPHARTQDYLPKHSISTGPCKSQLYCRICLRSYPGAQLVPVTQLQLTCIHGQCGLSDRGSYTSVSTIICYSKCSYQMLPGCLYQVQEQRSSVSVPFWWRLLLLCIPRKSVIIRYHTTIEDRYQAPNCSWQTLSLCESNELP